MQVSSINAGEFGIEGGLSVNVKFTGFHGLNASEAVLKVLASIATWQTASREEPATVHHVTLNPDTTDAEAAPTTTTRTRRPRGVTPTPLEAQASIPAAQLEEGKAGLEQSTEAPSSRRRRTTAPTEAEGPKPITDTDLTKAASNAAASMGPEGPGTVMAVLADFGVTTVNNIEADKREQFLKELQAEVEAYEAEKASA